MFVISEKFSILVLAEKSYFAEIWLFCVFAKLSHKIFVKFCIKVENRKIGFCWSSLLDLFYGKIASKGIDFSFQECGIHIFLIVYVKTVYHGPSKVMGFSYYSPWSKTMPKWYNLGFEMALLKICIVWKGEPLLLLKKPIIALKLYKLVVVEISQLHSQFFSQSYSYIFSIW